MKKIISTVCAVLFMVSASFAVEWGGIINDNTKGSTQNFDSFALQQSNSLYFWLKTPVGKNTFFSAEAFYKYTLDLGNGEKSFLNVIDSDMFKLSGNYKAGNGKFSFDVGRFSVADVSSSVFSQLSDGVSLRYNLPTVRLSAYAGYTGLLNAFSVSMVDDRSVGTPNEQIYTLCHGYVPVMVNVVLPVIFNNQSLSFGFNIFTDVEPTKSNKYYGNLVLSGPLANTLFYRIATTFGSDNFKNCMNYSNIQMYIFPIPTTMIVIGAEYASGNNGFLSPYQSITYIPASKAFDSPLLSGVILPQVTLSVTFGEAWLGANAKYVLGFEKDVSNKGLELGCSFAYNIFTDLKVGCDIAAYMDFSNSGNSLYTATLNAALAF
ncbi:MAG: hypothetical protein K6A43_04710 [Treponema sp.]|nr:hypothetical protein [Treponema sp.]